MVRTGDLCFFFVAFLYLCFKSHSEYKFWLKIMTELKSGRVGPTGPEPHLIGKA